MKSQYENSQEPVESNISMIREDIHQDYKLVLKGNALIEARYGLSVTAQKLFLGLIARVDPTSSKLPAFKLSRKELQDMDIGVGKQTVYRNFTSACLELLGLRVSLVEKNLNTGEVEDTDINIFSRNTRKWKNGSREDLKEVEFRFTKDVEPYLRDFNSDIRYTKYLYRYIKGLPTSHSIRIYELLRRWRNIKETKPVISKLVDLADLREMLGIEPGKYKNFSNFKTRILEPAQEQIKENTDIRFEFKGESGSRGKKIERIRFEIYDNTETFEEINEDKVKTGVVVRDDVEIDPSVCEKLMLLFPELKDHDVRLYSLFETYDLAVLKEAINEYTFKISVGEAKDIRMPLKYFNGICSNKQSEFRALLEAEAAKNQRAETSNFDDRSWADGLELN